jgi:ubiquinone/menaquinone biosynthesis C-methylase UbiE
MIERLIGYMRCPGCSGSRLRAIPGAVLCGGCSACYPIEEGILDMMPRSGGEVITPFQRLMQTPLVVGIYERRWRRLGYFIASSRSFDAEIATVLRLQQDDAEGSALDLGCGTGVFTRPLARRLRGVVVGLDLSRPMLRQARRLAVREGLDNIVLIRGTAFRLPFIAESFAHLNCCGALHLFDRPEPALAEMARVLHRRGRLSIQTTIRPGRSAGMAWFLERFIRFGFFAEDGLREMIRRHGFKIVESERHRISYTLLARHISWRD